MAQSLLRLVKKAARFRIPRYAERSREREREVVMWRERRTAECESVVGIPALGLTIRVPRGLLTQ
jgi:hypothetical protein